MSGEAVTPNRSEFPQQLREMMEDILTDWYSRDENKPLGEAVGFHPHITTRGTTILPLPVAFEDRDSDQLPFQFVMEDPDDPEFRMVYPDGSLGISIGLSGKGVDFTFFGPDGETLLDLRDLLKLADEVKALKARLDALEGGGQAKAA